MESRKNGTDEPICRAEIETQRTDCRHSGRRRGGQIERVALKHRHTVPEIASGNLQETAGGPEPCDSFVFLTSVLCRLPESRAAFASEMPTFMRLRKLNARARACDLQHSE